MKILLERKKLVELLHNAEAYVVSKKATLPALQGVLLSVTSSKSIMISATDIEVYLQQSMEVEAQEDLVGKKYILDSKFLNNLLTKLDGDTIVLEFLKTTAKLTTNGTSYTISFLDGEDFLQPPKMKAKPVQIDFETKVLKNYLNKCLPFVTSDDDSTPVFTGVHFVIQDKKVRLEASTRAVVLKAVDETECEHNIDIIIPAKFASTYLKVYKGEDSALYVDKEAIKLDGENFSLHCKLVDGKYPNVEGLFATELPNSIELKKDEMIPALKRLLLVNSASKISKWSTKKDELVIESENIDFAMKGKETFAYPHKGYDIVIGLNPDFIIKAMSAFREDVVTLHYVSNDKLVRIDDKHGSVKVLVAPLAI